MGVAAGLIRLHHDEETNKETTDNNNSNNKKEPTSLQTTLNQMAPFRITFLDCSLKTIVDLCSLLLLSVPIFVQVFPPVPFMPRLSLFSVLANVLFVLPQLVVIIGKWLFHDFATEKKPFEAQQFYIVTKIVLYSCDVFLDYCEVNGLDGGLKK